MGINTTQKGDFFEEEIFNYFKKEIEDGEFWSSSKCCKIYKKKGYYSEARKSEIIFDVAIEISLPNKDSWSSLVLIECKNYSSRIPVSDVEEFFQKARQISASVKCVVAATNSFQEGAITFSDSKGIGLLRYYSPNKLKWKLTRSPQSIKLHNFVESNKLEQQQAFESLRNEEKPSDFYECFSYVNNQYFTSFNEFLFQTVISGCDDEIASQLMEKRSFTKKSQNVKYVHENDIEVLCNEVRKIIGYTSGAVCLIAVCKWLSDDYGLKVVEKPTIGNGVLGQITFNPLEIIISRGESDNIHRKRFTLAHEIGHFLLCHDQYISEDRFTETDMEISYQTVNKTITSKDILRMEAQANYFASQLLLPKTRFEIRCKEILEKHNISNRGHGALFLDDQLCNKENYYLVTNELKKEFNVSRQVIKIRMKALGLLREIAGKKSNTNNRLF